MPLPILAQCLTHPPCFLISTPIHQVTHALSQYTGDALTHLIIVDKHRRPTGALSIRYLWRYADLGVNSDTLEQFQSQVEPTVQVYGQQTLAAAWPLPPPETAPPMVVVDDEMRYLGVVSPGIVLGHLCKELRVDQPGSRVLPRSAGPVPEATPKPWLLEISHALKNPMTSLLGLSTLLLDARVGELNARQTRYATLIQQVVRKLISLLNQLLDWTRLDTGQLTFDSEVIPLQPFAQGVIESYRTQLSSTQAQADWIQNFSLDLPCETAVLKADPMRLRLSLHWLLDYFLHHQADPGGLQIAPTGPWLGLTLWTRASLSPIPETLSALGEATPASNPSTIRPSPVEDLGLLLTRRFCQGQGGDLSYRFTSSGTWITLFLPVPSAAAGNATPSSVPAKELVLFVGHRAEVIEALWQQLQHSAYQLAVAHGVAEAEGMIQRLQPTVVLGCQQSFPDAMAALRHAAHVSLPQAEIYFRTLSAEADAPEAGASSAEPTVAMTDLKAHLDQLLAASSAQPSRSGLPTLTLLLLPQASQPSEQPPVLTTELQAWLQHYQCRLLQVDDLPQARVMSRVWQPDALLIDTSLPMPPEDWQALTQAPEMALLPVVMLTAHGPWGHNHQHGLRVYCCPMAGDLSAEQNALSLIRTIETALGE